MHRAIIRLFFLVIAMVLPGWASVSAWGAIVPPPQDATWWPQVQDREIQQEQTPARLATGGGGHVYIGETLPTGFYDNLFRTRLSTTPREDNLTAAPSDDIDPAWSPTGDAIVFSSNGLDTNSDGKIDAVGDNYNLWSIKPDGSSLVQVTSQADNETQPAWFPNARQIAYISDRTGRPQVWVMDRVSGEQYQVTFDAGNKAHPTVGSQGLIAFASDLNGNWDIWVVYSDGTGLAQITYDPAEDIQPAFAWDKLTLGFASKRSGQYRIYTIPSSNKDLPEDQRPLEPGLQQRTSGGGSGVNDTEPAFRPVDNSLVFTSDRPIGPSDTGSDTNVWKGAADIDLGSAGIWDGSPVLAANFRPDDTFADGDATCNPAVAAEHLTPMLEVIYTSNRTGNNDIWSIVPEGDDYEPPRLMDLPVETPKAASTITPVTIKVRVEDNFDDWDTNAQGQRRRVNYDKWGTRQVWATIYQPYDFNRTGYGINNVTIHVNHPGWPDPKSSHGDVTDNNIVLNARWPHNSPWDTQSAALVDSIYLTDDGTGPDEVAWDGIYTATWTPPAESDYFIGIGTRDWAGNYFGYDNVGGFSRAPFYVSDPPAILLVLDWAEGQKWTAASVDPYSTRVPLSSAPVEMFWLGYSGVSIIYGDPDTPLPQGQTVVPDLSVFENWTIWQDNHLDNLYHSWVPRDVWRTQCRGPIPRTVLAGYMPSVQMQPDPQDPQWKLTRPTAHAFSCVVWAAPYTGDMWVQAGSLLDVKTQSDLTWFTEGGGRLWVSGQDIAWGLTRGGLVESQFLTSILGASFVNDWSQTNVLDGAGILSEEPGQQPATPFPPWPSVPDPKVNDPPKVLFLGALQPLPGYTNLYQYEDADASVNQGSSDVIAPVGNAQTHFTWRGGTGGAAGTMLERATSLGVKTRTVYFSFGFESIHRMYTEYNTTPTTTGTGTTTSSGGGGGGRGSASVAAAKQRGITRADQGVDIEYCRNYRGKVWHNAICWLTSVRFLGAVYDLKGLFPIEKALVLIDPVLTGDGNFTLDAPYTAITDKNGTFQIDGIPAGAHTVLIVAAGYFWHYNARFGYLHGQEIASGVDFKLTQAEPGGISGTITAEGTGTPVAGATTTATLIGFYHGSPLELSALSQSNGTYEIMRLPTGFYNLTATAPNYGTANKGMIEVKAATITEGVDFQLPAAPGSLSGTVTDLGTGNPIQNATVEAVAAGQVTGTATTDAAGHYQIAAIAAGAHDVTASAVGYTAMKKVVTIEPAQAKVLDFALSTAPPGSVSGVVKEAATGLPSAGAVVSVFLGQQEVASTTTAADYTTEGGYSFNYRLQVPVGTFQLRVSKINRTAAPEFRTVTVVSQQEAKNINFDLEALRSFATGISFVSFPYEYAGLGADPSIVLGLPPSQLAGNLAYWDGTAYAVYPTPPTDALALGRGYFLRLTEPAVVETEGTTTASDPFVIPLLSGWNMVGDPFLATVDWYDVKVRSGGNVYSMTDALAQGLIQGRLWSFDGTQYKISLFLNPWVGNWVQAGQDVELLVPVPARSGLSGLGRAVANAGQAERVVQSGWGFGLVARIGEASDTIYIGSSPTAKEGYDVLDAVQPPAIVGESIIDAYFDNSGWGAEAGKYGVEVKGDLSSGRKRWEFTVDVGVKEASVFLAWPDLKAVPASVALTLEDVDTGQRQDMRQTATYKFNSGSGGQRHFAVTAEKRSAGTIQVTGLAVAKAGRVRALDISFVLSQPGWVTMEMLNLAGERVRLVKDGEMMAAGGNQVVWDGRNEQGAWVPNGSYICEVTAKNEAGEVVNVLRTFVLMW